MARAKTTARRQRATPAGADRSSGDRSRWTTSRARASCDGGGHGERYEEEEEDKEEEDPDDNRRAQPEGEASARPLPAGPPPSATLATPKPQEVRRPRGALPEQRYEIRQPWICAPSLLMAKQIPSSLLVRAAQTVLGTIGGSAGETPLSSLRFGRTQRGTTACSTRRRTRRKRRRPRSAGSLSGLPLYGNAEGGFPRPTRFPQEAEREGCRVSLDVFYLRPPRTLQVRQPWIFAPLVTDG